MPGKGNDKHKILVREATKIVANKYYKNLHSILVEQVQFTVNAGLSGYGYHRDSDAKRDHYPDIIVSTLSDEKDDYGNFKIDKRLVIECENGLSTLITGKPSIRNYGYKLIREKHKDLLIFVLVTWEKFKDKVKNDLWDEVWYIKDELSLEKKE